MAAPASPLMTALRNVKLESTMYNAPSTKAKKTMVSKAILKIVTLVFVTSSTAMATPSDVLSISLTDAWNSTSSGSKGQPRSAANNLESGLAAGKCEESKCQVKLIIMPGEGHSNSNDRFSQYSNGRNIYSRLTRVLQTAGLDPFVGNPPKGLQCRDLSSGFADFCEPALSEQMDYYGRLVEQKTADPSISCVWLVGHSFGGWVAIALAAQSEEVCGVILIGVPSGRYTENMLRHFEDGVLSSHYETVANVAQSLESDEAIDFARLPFPINLLINAEREPFMREATAYDINSAIKGNSKPIMILHGGKDQNVPVWHATVLKRLAPCAQLRIIESADHQLRHRSRQESSAVERMPQHDRAVIDEATSILQQFITDPELTC